MVKVKEDPIRLSDGTIDLENWLVRLEEKKPNLNHQLIRNACLLSQLAGIEMPTESGESCLQQGLAMAEILVDLDVDSETIAAAVIYDSVQYAELTIEDINEHLGSKLAKLVNGVDRMNAIGNMRGMNRINSRHQIDNIRKMLLSMVDDARCVLIKLAERLRVLRTIAPLAPSFQQTVAVEVKEIYAPLANRLGIGSIKWEMEDLAFRYLNPDKYKEIAKGLKSRRLDRDRYVTMIVEQLTSALEDKNLRDFKVYGRSKHIHSIFRKMSRKNVPIDEIYDATAVRVLTSSLEDCYVVLGVVHDLWQQIIAEFDDYIANPKPNGYKSLHTAVIGPEEKAFEVQIRTYQMHDEAELGVAAHWKYKEGTGFQKENHEQKIDWLREVLEWHRELAQGGGEEVDQDLDPEIFLDDRVYIFTPGGDVLDLPVGSTPLDFAYRVHSEIGHRCRGAKVDGRIVQLTHELKTGEQVEILTGNEARPSRDWLNPHLNYLKSSRAKAKIHHWFKQQDFDKNKEEGAAILERELKRLDLKSDGLLQVAKSLNFKKKDDLLAALGRGDVRFAQILQRLPDNQKDESDGVEKLIKEKKTDSSKTSQATGDVQIQGVGNLLTHIARCCQPVPGDQIIGYITSGRGISIHQQECPNIIHANESQRTRFIEVDWGEEAKDGYKVDVVVHAYDRNGLLRDVTQLLSTERANVFSLSTNISKEENTAVIYLTVEVSGLDALSRLLDKIKQIQNVIDVRRQN